LNILNDSTQGHEVLAKADEMEAQKERMHRTQSAVDVNGSAAHTNMKSHSETGALCADETGNALILQMGYAAMAYAY